VTRTTSPRPYGTRRKELDDDDATTNTIQEAFATWMETERPTILAESEHRWFTAAHMTEALGKICPHGSSPVHVGRWLNSMSLPNLKRVRTGERRMWVWRGSKALPAEPEEW
jgi:hypothetical protein